MISKRIELLISDKKLSKRAFSRSINCTDTAINNIISGRNEPGFKILEAILQTYDSVSPDWLILGKGDIYRKDNSVNSEDFNTLSEFIKNQKDEIQELKAMLKEKDKQLGELIKTNLMLLVREKGRTDALPDEAAKCADAG